MWRKIFIFLGVSLVLIVAAAFIIPSFINWNHYRETMTASLARAIDAKVTISGDIRFSMLPRPRLEVEDVDITDANWQTHIDRLTLAARLAPLWHGQLEVTRAVLEQPQILYHWPQRAAVKPRVGRSATALPIGVLAAASGGMANTIALKEIVLNDGTLSIAMPGRPAPLSFMQLNGRLTASALHGPYEFKGGFASGARHFNSHLQIGVASGAGSFPLSAALKSDAGLTFNLQGALQGFAGASSKTPPRLVGDIRLIAQDLSFTGPLQLSAHALASDNMNVAYQDVPLGNLHSHWQFSDPGGPVAALSLKDIAAPALQQLVMLTDGALPALIARRLPQLGPWQTADFDYANGAVTHLNMAAVGLQLSLTDGIWQADGDNLAHVLDVIQPLPQPWRLAKPFHVTAAVDNTAVQLHNFDYGDLNMTGTVHKAADGWHSSLSTDHLTLADFKQLAAQCTAWPTGHYQLKTGQLDGTAADPGFTQLQVSVTGGSVYLIVKTGAAVIRMDHNGRAWHSTAVCTHPGTRINQCAPPALVGQLTPAR